MPEKSKHLAEYLFNPSIVQHGIDKAGRAVEDLRENMGNKEAEAKLNKALDNLIAVLEATEYGPFQRLTDDENDQFAILLKKKFEERRSGRGHKWKVEIKLNDEEEFMYQHLQAKAYGRVMGP